MKNTKRRGTLKLLKPLYNKIESLQTNILKVSEFEFTEQLFIFLENIPIYIASNTQYRSDISTLIQSALSTLDASLQLYIEQYSKNLNSTRLIDAFLNLSKSLKFILDNSLDQNYFTKIISLIEIFIKELEVFLDDYLIRSYSKLQSASTTSLKSLSIKVKKLFRQQESLPVRQSVSLPTLPRITKEPALFSRKSLALLFRKIDYTIPLKLDIDSNRDSIESKKRWSLFTDITESKKRNTINQETIQISPIAELIPLQNQNVLFTREKLTYTLNGIAYLVIGINASRNCIVSATLHQLFVSLFNGYDQDEMFLDAVISCHKFYSSTLEFLSKIEWFFEPANIACIWNTSEPRQIQLKVCNFLERWIKLQYQDFIYLDAAMKLDKIVYEIKKLGLTNESARLSGLCEMMQTRIKTIKELKSRDSFKEILEVSSKSSCDPFHSILGLCANKSSVLLDISTIDIARYFTAGDFRLFCHLNIHLLINDIPEDVEFSRILSRRFNTIRNWVALEICSSKANVRVKLVSKFIAIAQKCVEFSNFSSAFFIISALTSSTISRLKRIFDRLPRNDLESLLKMERLLDPSFNHQNYRTEFKDRSVPKIPFLPIIYKDLKFINSSRESYPKTDSMINFQPFAVLYEVLSSHLLSSDARYTFQAQYDFAFKEMGQFGKYTVSESYGPETLRIIGLCRLLSDRISFAKDVDSKDGQMNRARMIADSIS